MSIKRAIPVLACVVFLWACEYIVTPAPDVTPTPASSRGWNAVVTSVGEAGAGTLHVDITLRNDTAQWSSLEADKTATFTGGDGKSSTCDTVFVNTGGNSLAPGFQIRGYTGGTKAEPEIQLLYVECEGVQASPGSKLSVGYKYVTGDYNYYSPSTPVSGKLELNLDQVVTDLKYPVAEEVPGVIEKADVGIEAINAVTLTLTSATRTDAGFEFSWQTKNPGEYPVYVHIGMPPVIGADGIIYGFYESPHLADTPITPAGDVATWTTNVAVPKDVTGLYILLSVESKKQKLFVTHAVDITDK